MIKFLTRFNFKPATLTNQTVFETRCCTVLAVASVVKFPARMDNSGHIIISDRSEHFINNRFTFIRQWFEIVVINHKRFRTVFRLNPHFVTVDAQYVNGGPFRAVVPLADCTDSW